MYNVLQLVTARKAKLTLILHFPHYAIVSHIQLDFT